MAKVSIIVPIYNAEKYIEKCLNSLVNQTLTDIEIICVNDGSTDNSMTPVKKLAEQDSRIKILEQSNKKQGAARNYGTSIATGEYIGFVDSDDWVDLDYYEKLYQVVKDYDADITFATNVRVGNGKTKKRLNIQEIKEYTDLQDKFDACDVAKNPCPTNKIYRLSLLKDNNIVWPEGCYCEDKLFVTQAVFFANKVVTVPDVNYYYYRNPKSTVNLKSSNHYKTFIADKNQAHRDVLNFLINQNAQIRDKDFWAVKTEYRICNTAIFRVSESLYTQRYNFLGLKLFDKALKR